MKRIMIVGQPGSGKSTLALALGHATGLPVIHIDRMHWQSGWVERSMADKDRLCHEAEAGDEWIFEGGHSRTWPSRLARADFLVWLDRPVLLRLWRVTRRAVLNRGRSRPDMAEGCPERLRLLPGFLAYIWTTHRSARIKISKLTRMAGEHCTVVRLRSGAEVEQFLRSPPFGCPR